MTTARETCLRRTYLGASRRRLEDALVLFQAKRWTGAIYIGGYAIECSLKALICYQEGKNDLQQTTVFQNQQNKLLSHNLHHLLAILPEFERTITSDRIGDYKNAWNIICQTWKTNQLRYSDKQGDQKETKKFLDAVKILHQHILSIQGESS